jgi:hypothetical protein
MILYKYCHWRTIKEETKDGIREVNYTKENLKEAALYFADPKTFNDPFDMLPIVKIEDDIKKIHDFATKVLKKDTNLSHGKARKVALSRVLTNTLFNNKKGRQELSKIMAQGFRQDVGVCCFTTK